MSAGAAIRVGVAGAAGKVGEAICAGVEAADDLVRRALAIGRALRTSGFAVSTELPYDMAALSLLCELDEIAAAGGDVRSRLFGA